MIKGERIGVEEPDTATLLQDNSFAEHFAETKNSDLATRAINARIENIMKNTVDSLIESHTSTLNSPRDWENAYQAYSMDYFLSLPIHHAGLQRLGESLIECCKKAKKTPPESWLNLSNAQFPWEKELESNDIYSEN
jgi:hypothetical protein